jgi:hypothetical protein
MADGQGSGAERVDVALLDDMREFVCQEVAALQRRRGVSAGRKDDLLTDRVGERVQCLSRLCRQGIGMDTNTAEIAAEAALEIGASVLIERLARKVNDIVNNGWSFRGRNSAASPTYWFPLLLFRAGSARGPRAFAGALAAHYRFSSLGWMHWRKRVPVSCMSRDG